ncbi:myosin-2 essential light chain [Lingula anatina]|uniref:Myosin-2 essential light chain n=1 Tax=Lingula anatina TaxID=7574 RepID=A0A1S3H473_LINAN|nr:myosin-2 essential light chain-like [Lingula anatina]XP_013393606.1 myosin-2 essential light chain [Lingula anatina]|eukprot:XP_013379939.1 myosin-2 essential light chain-like [Lingula anatina]
MAKTTKLTDDQIFDLQETFNLFDNRGDGKIYAGEIGNVLRAMGQNPTEADVKKCVFQEDPDQRVSFEQFIPILQTVMKNQDTTTAEDFIEGFKVFDKDQNGFIGSAELRHLLSSLGEKLSDEEVEQLLQNMEDSQGNVNYEEFVKMVMAG